MLLPKKDETKRTAVSAQNFNVITDFQIISLVVQFISIVALNGYKDPTTP